jgi:pimeloyl-ACP methyl ester carboxylesterase
MPYVNNGGVRIHYQVEGEGPALVLQHGFTESVTDWYESGYVGALTPDYRLILIDARGHGASDKPHDPDAYALNRRVSDVAAVLDIIPNYKQTWANIRKISDAPEVTQRLTFKSQEYASG